MLSILVASLWLTAVGHARAVSVALPRPVAPIARTLGWVPAGLVLLALTLGCTPLLGPVDGCPPRATRCGPRGTAQACSGTGRWHDDGTGPCAQLGPDVTCCYTRSPYGRELHACVPRSACLPEPPADAGTDASSTMSEGGVSDAP